MVGKEPLADSLFFSAVIKAIILPFRDLEDTQHVFIILHNLDNVSHIKLSFNFLSFQYILII